MRAATAARSISSRQFVSAACLLLFFYLALTTALAKAPTVDEPIHLTRAIALQQAGDLTLQGEHAPLSHRLAGMLLAAEALPDLYQLSSWSGGDRREIASELLWDQGLDVERLIFLARLPLIWLGILLGAFIGSWAFSWQGKLGMTVALILFATSPNLTAHATLVTTDLAAAATYFAAVYAWWLYWRQRQRKWWLLAAIFLGLALAAKLTAVLLLPVLLILALLTSGRGRDRWRPIWTWGVLLLPALLVMWLVYGLEAGPFDHWPWAVPAPSYLASWQSVLSHVEGGHPSYFLGELSESGRWAYFPVTFLIKTPLVTLILLLIALLVVVRRRELWPTALFLLLPASALFAAAIISRLNIGYRHILPALPFLLVFSSAAVILLRRRRLTVLLLVLGLAWSVASAMRQNPHFLAYFNEAVGGTGQGYRYLGDSNLDWGQDINLLADTVAKQAGDWTVAYYGTNDPRYFGLPEEAVLDLDEARESFPAANPPAGRYAISANYLQGQLTDADFFDWFRHQEPVENLGGSIQIYEIGEQAHGHWIAQCLDPIPLLTAAEAETLVESGPVRQLTFDCRQSFVLADFGSAGWFILPQADRWWFQEELPPVDDRLQLVYRHDAAAGLPSFDVFYWPGTSDISLAEGWSQEAESAAGLPISLPHSLNDFGQLNAYKSNETTWLLQWEILSAAAEPMTLMAHLAAGEGEPQLVADSLGLSSDQWQAGDWLLQRFVFPEHEDARYMETGMYNYLTMEKAGEIIRLPGSQRPQ